MKKIYAIMLIVLMCCLTACDSESSGSSGGKIEMPKSAEDYCGSEYTIDELTEYFEDLGFTNIRTVACEPDEDKYRKNIFEIYIETGLFSTDPWKAGEKYDADAEISIYYNEEPLLTVDNCEDLVTVLNSTDMDYMTFANKYDGRYVEFNAYVYDHSTYDGGTSHIIDVAGGDKVSDKALGLIIRIGDRTWGNSIDESVEKGQLVVVSGKIDASWCEYYKQLYVECEELKRR